MATGYPYFKIEPRSGGWRGLYFGGNDELMWWTEVYVHYAGAKYAIDHLKANAASAPIKP